jgi:hypothetical protein|nr:MAG TPA: holin protein [Caudoviricetes sp.]DAI79645.1 MAG TPA: holin protein [Caudoviricetes sp.]
MDTASILGFVGIVFASNGFWQFLQTRFKKKTPVEKAVLAMLHDRLMHLLICYIEADYLTAEDLENLTDLYESYRELGGNGTIKRLYERVCKLEIRHDEI